MTFHQYHLRQSKFEVPVGWTPIKENEKRILYRCPHIGFSIENEYRRCSYQCRKNRIHLHKEHAYTIPQQNDEYFPKFFMKTIEKKTHEQINKKVRKSIAKFAGKADVERNFSKKREIHGKHATNINLKTVQSRVNLYSDANR